MTSRTADQLLVRFSDGLKDRIKEEALRHRRSMNSQVVFLLEQALFDPLEMKKGTEVSA
ncbi:hypothetical protein RsS62_23910 [Rhizobium dioscoreae]|uniref:Arc family DNA-binding protein n=1 Tax=Rhizobium dioscoreae TaxID=2653122 RepID=UPI00127B11D3|nr:Arc family DNA-binding protein [Rhizobium dioscoreae]GES43139.1 hypothetical protein RsS62_23910 [Rhizobium dioscoreae]